MPQVYVSKELYDKMIERKLKVSVFVNKTLEEALKEKEKKA